MEERTVTVYTQPLEEGSLLDSELLASGELKVTKDPSRGKHITDVGGVMVRAARKLDSDSTIRLADASGGPLRWKILVSAAGVKCNLIIRPYGDASMGIGGHTVMLQCKGTQEGITSLIKTFAVLLDRHPCQDMDWDTFQSRSGIEKDSVTGFWDSLLPPGGMDAGAGEEGDPLDDDDGEEGGDEDALDRQYRTATMSALIKEGVAHFKEERYPEALAVWEKVLELDPEHKSTLAAVARVKELMGGEGKGEGKAAPAPVKKVARKVTPMIKRNCPKCSKLLAIRPVAGQPLKFKCSKCGTKGEFKRKVRAVKPAIPKKPIPTVQAPAPAGGDTGTLPVDKPAEDEIPPPVSPYAAGTLTPGPTGLEESIVKGAADIMKEMGMEPPPTAGGGPAQTPPSGEGAGDGPVPKPIPKVVPRPVAKKPIPAGARPVPRVVKPKAAPEDEGPEEKPDATPVVSAADVMASMGAVSAGEAEDDGEAGALPDEAEGEEEYGAGEAAVEEEEEEAPAPVPAAAPAPKPIPFIIEPEPQEGVMSGTDIMEQMKSGADGATPRPAPVKKVRVRVPVGGMAAPMRSKGPLAAPVPDEPEEPPEPAAAPGSPADGLELPDFDDMVAPSDAGPETPGPGMPAPAEVPAAAPAVPEAPAPPPPISDPDAQYRRGLALAEKGIWQQALSVFDQVLLEQPDHLDALNDKGVVLFNTGRRTEAQEIYDKVHRIDPDRIDTWFNKAHLLLEEDRLRPALDCFKKVLEKEPDNGDAWYFRGLILFRLDRYEESAKNFEQAARVSPREADTWFNHAYALERARKYDSALEAYQKVLALDPRHVQAEYGQEACLREIRLELLKDWNP